MDFPKNSISKNIMHLKLTTFDTCNFFFYQLSFVRLAPWSVVGIDTTDVHVGLTLSDLKHGLTYSTPIDVTKEDTYATSGMLAIVPDSSIAVSLMNSGMQIRAMLINSLHVVNTTATWYSWTLLQNLNTLSKFNVRRSVYDDVLLPTFSGLFSDKWKTTVENTPTVVAINAKIYKMHAYNHVRISAIPIVFVCVSFCADLKFSRIVGTDETVAPNAVVACAPEHEPSDDEHQDIRRHREHVSKKQTFEYNAMPRRTCLANLYRFQERSNKNEK